MGQIGGDQRSTSTVRSKKTMTASELQRFFEKNQEEIKSKYSGKSASEIVSNYKAKFMKKFEGTEAEDVKSPRNIEEVRSPRVAAIEMEKGPGHKSEAK